MATTAVLRSGTRRALTSYRALRASVYSGPQVLQGVAAAPQTLLPLAGGIWARSMANGAAIKEVVNVFTVGPIGHGKTTVVAAVAKVVGEGRTFKSVSVSEQNEALGEEPTMQVVGGGTCKSISVPELSEALGEEPTLKVHLEYETSKRRYAYFDCPGRAEQVKKIIMGAGKVDALVLVLAVPRGPVPEALDLVSLARQADVPSLVCFLNQIDLINNPDALLTFELKLREILRVANYPGDRVAIIRGSALSALQEITGVIGRDGILNLMQALDNFPMEGVVDQKEVMDFSALSEVTPGQQALVKYNGEPGKLTNFTALSNVTHGQQTGGQMLLVNSKDMALLIQATRQVSMANAEEIGRQVDRRMAELGKKADLHMDELGKKADLQMQRSSSHAVIQAFMSFLVLLSTGLIIFAMWKMYGMLHGVLEYLTNNPVVNTSKTVWKKTKEGWEWVCSIWRK